MQLDWTEIFQCSKVHQNEIRQEWGSKEIRLQVSSCNMSLNCSTLCQMFLLLVGKDWKTLWKLKSAVLLNTWKTYLSMRQKEIWARIVQGGSILCAHLTLLPTCPFFVTVLGMPFVWTSTATCPNIQHSYKIHILTEQIHNWLKYVW